MTPSHVQAQTSRPLSVGGIGRDLCASWTKDRESSSEQSRLDSQKRIEWVLGFFTAANLFTQNSGVLHGGTDDQIGMLGWIDSHCKDNPDDPVFVGAVDYYLDLRNHPRP